MKTLDWKEIALVAVLLAGIVCAQIWAPGMVSTVVGIASTVVAWMLKGPGGGSSPPGAVAGASAAAMALALSGCAIFGPAERTQTTDYAAALEKCMEVGRMAPDGGHVKAYEACKKDGGL